MGLLHEVTAGHDPSGVAIRFAGLDLTYRQLAERSDDLAGALAAYGIGCGDIVALLLERGPQLLVAQIAVMKTGAAWMPLDPQHPPARLAFQISDARAGLLLTTSGLAHPGSVETWNLDELPTTGEPQPVEIRPEDPAYLMYTSGSTGNPKGVLVPHHAAYRFCQNAVDLFGLGVDDRVAQVANPAFDVSVFDTFATLLAGATLIGLPREVAAEPAALTALLLRERVTVAFTPPALLSLLDPGRLAGSDLRALLSAGEALGADLANRWSRPGLALHNGYGPTEATVLCTSHLCAPGPLTAPPPIGTALPHHRVYVLNKRLRLAPIGVPGQLYVSGSGVAHGYLNQPGLTAERFLADPFTDQPGQRMYNTGDQARWRTDGALEYLGRTDRQVQLRGQRIELGEIEHALGRHPGVRQNAVVLRDGTYLAAYIVGEPDPAELRQHLADRLPTYMIPGTVVTLPELPVTPNGKVDTARLPDPQPVVREYLEPRTATEHWLADTWQTLLGVQRVSAGDSFFERGGNSLHATQLTARIRDSLGILVETRHLFTHPVLRELAALVDAGEAAPAADVIRPVARDRELPCTHQQEGLWFMHQVDPASTVYHLPFALRLRGDLDVAALEEALHALVVRHEALRTRFVAHDGLPWQVIDPPPAAPVHRVVAEVDEARLGQWAAEEAYRPLDLADGPVFRAAVARTGPGDHVLVLVVHHIVADGWSAKILAAELSELYAGNNLKPLTLQPADHAAWQRDRLNGTELEQQLGFWRDNLAGLAPIGFPADRPRPAHPTGAGAAATRRLPGDLTEAARAYARTNRVSFLAVLQAALLTVLHRYTGQDDLPIGSIFSGRTRADLEPLVGYFANTLVLRTDAGGNPTFAELVGRCHDTVLNATAHQDVPFGLVVDALQPERVTGRNPLFQISLTLQPAGAGADTLTLGSASAEPLDITGGHSRFDIGIDAIDTTDGGIDIGIEYSTELFNPDRIDRLIDHLVTTLTAGLATPGSPAGELELLSTADHDRLVHTWNPPSTGGASGLLHEVTAGHDPDSVAIRFAGVDLTYRQLAERSDDLAGALAEHGIGPGHIVGLLFERGLHLPVAELAVLKAGAAWMPLDPQHPAARLAYQIDDARAELVLTTSGLAHLVSATTWNLDDRPAGSGKPRPVGIRPEDPAYLIYTSGSTGQPKGVLVSHRSAVTYARNAVDQFTLRPSDRVPQIANPAFDATIFDIYATLLAGATLVSAPRQTISDASALTSLLVDEHITVSYLPPAILGILDPKDLIDSDLRGFFSAAEALSADLVNRWTRPGLAVHNSYGPTETTVCCTDYPCPGSALQAPPAIGSALPDQRTYILDGRLRPAPIGVPGQLHVGGAGVAQGYLNRPALTAERFLADPFTDRPGDRMYNTGDQARWRSDGTIEFLGRTDRQIQLRGQRIELGEIEHVLGQHPRIRQNAVVLRDGTYLAAYLVGDPDPTELRQHLADRLPTYMIPGVVVTLPKLPVTPNGKVDTANLPDPQRAGHEYLEPRTTTERWLAETWQTLLDVESVGAGDSFFDLGGNSLHATQLFARIRDQLGIEIETRRLFTDPVLEHLAARLDEAGTATAGPALVPVSRNELLVATHQQEGLWFLDRLDPGSPVYYIPFALRLRGHLDLPALQRALHALVVRHEALRTRFVEHAGLPRQVIDPPPEAAALRVADVDAGQVSQWVSREWRQPLDLAHGPVFRTAVARLAPDEHVLVLVVHHIVADGWSAKILAGELTGLYAGTSLEPLTLQPADHAAWQRAQLDGGELDRQRDYWRTELRDLPTVDFPADRPRPARPTGAGSTVARRLPNDVALAAHAYARTNRVSFLAVLQAALLTVLHRYTGQDDLPIGSIFSGRTRAALEPLVGYFANTLVLRTDAGGNPTFAELVGRCHDTVLNATAHQDVPFGLVVDALQPERVTGRNPLFQISLTLQPAGAGAGALTLGTVTAEPLDIDGGHSRFDLAIDAIDTADGGLDLGVEYSTELFNPDRIQRLLDHLVTALTTGLASPGTSADDLELLAAADRHQLLHAWNPAPVERTPGLLHEVTAGHDRDSVAIRFAGIDLTYRQLEERSDDLAAALIEHGIGPGHIVGLLFERGLHLPVAELAVLKTGAAWMPLDPQHPPARLAYQIDDARAGLVLTTSGLAHLVDARTWHLDHRPSITGTPRPVEIHPEDPAYLIYTSGSTGHPKGVLVSHRSAVEYCRNAVGYLGVVPGDRVAQVANPAFDATIFEIYATLLAGATLVGTPRQTISDPAALTSFLVDEHITVAYLPPAILGILNPKDLIDSDLRGFFSAAEALSADLVNRWTRPGLAVHNSYGPTETTVVCTNHLCVTTPLDGPPPIGVALPNHRAYLLDDRLRPVPIGVPGQLYISGSGVAHGYLNRPALTAEQFLADPFTDRPGQRMYNTGDQARWRTDGTIDFLGRTDRQVQLRGQRIELGEIEHVLGQHPRIRQNAVVLRDGTYLAAYLVGDPDPTDLRQHLADRLPTYMIPASIVTLPELPVTPNGKTDTRRLPDPQPAAQEYTEPRTTTERWLAATWQTLLDVETVGAGDSFFDLGGNSLHATQLIARIRDDLGVEVDARALFVNPVLGELAGVLDSPEVTTPGDGVLPLHPLGSRTPLFFVHPVGGSVAHYVQLAALLGDDQPFYAIEDPGLRGTDTDASLTQRAERYVELVRRVRPEGPYRLGGWSLGGVIGLEMARQLTAAGAQVETVVALDSGLADGSPLDDVALLAAFVRDLAGIADVPPPEVDLASVRGLDRQGLEELALTVLDEAGLVPPGLEDELRARMRVFTANLQALAGHRPERYDGRFVLIGTAGNENQAVWRAVAPAVEHHSVPGNHYTMLQPPHLDALAATLRTCLDDPTTPSKEHR